ncbi:tetratricopeptide repeat-containing sensor histidine kinase [Foetidibacter luteolus]|uniref:tetratricopeptide repeat-containing sensor histidine kinase n=1 Tax=Foetidibacter luteolus TaxID=2608880 RepID=UPI00129BD4B2|nr:ATP-binding protein [Foetidibacter luteolus]
MPLNETLKSICRPGLHVWVLLFFLTTTSFSCNSFYSNRFDGYYQDVFDKVDAEPDYTAAEMRYLDSFFAAAKNPGPDNISNKYMRKVFYYRTASFNYDSVLLYADSAINLLEHYVNKDEYLATVYARAHFAKGQAYFLMKNYDEAIRYYIIGKLTLSARVKNHCEQYAYNESMANILFAQKKYLAAAAFFKAKYQMAEACAFNGYLGFVNTQENMDNTGICFYLAGITDSATFYYDATLEYLAKNESLYSNQHAADIELMKCIVYGNQAQVMERLNNYTQAEKLYLKSLAVTQKRDRSFSASSLNSLAKMYVATRQLKKAGEIIKSIPQFADTLSVSPLTQSFYKNLSEYYILTHKPYPALHALRKSNIIRDSIENRDKALNVTDIRREVENREQKNTNEKLKQANQLRNVYIMAAVAGIVLAISVILLVWSTSKRKSRYVNKLTLLNAEIQSSNEDLRKTLTSLEQSHKENNRIVKVVAHDLKNPISAIRTLVYSLLKKGQPRYMQETLDLIQTTCIDSMALIKDLLNDNPKLAGGAKEPVNMGRLVEQCTELFRAKAREKKQIITLQLDYPVLLLNRQKMWRVVSNIVNNAIKFSPENAEIKIYLQRQQHKVLLSIHDNGIGIPAVLKEKIFSLSPESSRPGTSGEESYGLGLSISHKIIEEHQGKLWFESQVGKGSVFYVELPYLN